MKRLIIILVTGIILAGGVAWAGMGDASQPIDVQGASAAVGHNREGIDHYNQRHWAVAMTHFMEAIKANPNLAEAHYNLALTLDKTEDHKTAAEHFKHAYDLGKDNSAIQNSGILKKHLNMKEPRRRMGY